MKVCIVGGVAGGAGTAARLRRNDEHAEIILFEKGEYISFANCGLPYYIGDVITEKSALQLQTPESFRGRFDVDVRVMSQVLSVDGKRKTIRVLDRTTGREYEESYDALVLSPGASPVRPPIPGADGEQVFTLRSIPDTYAIKEYVDSHGAKTAVVIGGGFIGLEMAENLHNLGMSVTLVEAADHVMASLDGEMAHDLHNHIRSKGVNLCLSSLAAEIAPGQVRLRDGRSIPADLVILSTGVAPETGFLADSGIARGLRGEILVDDRFTTSLPDVYAVGDAIAVRHIVSGKIAMVPLASPANRQARLVADIICGKDVRYSGAQGTAIAKVFDMTAATTGESEKGLQDAGIDYHKVYTYSASHAGYYPGGVSMQVKLLFDPQGVVLGAQIVGGSGVDKRIDILAVAVRQRLTVYDLQELELAYAPPFSSAKDPVNMVGYAAENLLEGRFHPFYIEDLETLPEDALLLDVRTATEFAAGTIPGAVHIPLDELRQRMDELPKGKELYIFCRVGLRGYIAERIVNQHGFASKNLSGGHRLYGAMEIDRAANAQANL